MGTNRFVFAAFEGYPVYNEDRKIKYVTYGSKVEYVHLLSEIFEGFITCLMKEMKV